MIYFLGFMQFVFGKMYPLIVSAAFAGLAAFFACFYDSPDKTALTLLSFAASLGWLCLHSAEIILGRLLVAMEGTTKILEELLKHQEK
jgi:hypothetical protein